jgi:hypothetical protein
VKATLHSLSGDAIGALYRSRLYSQHFEPSEVVEPAHPRILAVLYRPLEALYIWSEASS